MLNATPVGELRNAYLIGAIAAAERRNNPPYVAPAAAGYDIPQPPQDASLWGRNITVDELPYLVHPLIEQVREERPDLVLVADTGARFAGLALYQGWRRRYPDARFPTINGNVLFGKISKKIGKDATTKVVGHALHLSGIIAEAAQRQAEGNSQPVKVLFMDDWINEGKTVELVRDIVNEQVSRFGQTADLIVATMRGPLLPNYRHVSGDTRRDGYATWTNNTQMNGVSYNSGDGITPSVARSDQSRQARRDIPKAIQSQIAPSSHSRQRSAIGRASARPTGRPRWLFGRGS
jgi:hypothetical protein